MKNPIRAVLPFRAFRSTSCRTGHWLALWLVCMSCTVSPAQPAKPTASVSDSQSDTPPVTGSAINLQPVLAVGFTGDGNHVAVVGSSSNAAGRITLGDAISQNWQIVEKDIAGLSAAACGLDGKTVATGHRNGTVKLLDVPTRQWLELTAHAGEVHGLAFSPDGALLASAGVDRKVKLWNTKTPEEPREFAGHTDVVTSVAFFHDGKTMISGGRDNVAILWDIGAGQQKVLRGHSGAVEHVAVSANDEFVATSSRDGTIRIWDPKTGNEFTKLPGLPDKKGVAVWPTVAFSPKGHLLAAGVPGNAIQLVSVSIWSPAGVLRGHNGLVSAARFSADGLQLICGATNGGVKLWDVVAAKEMSSSPPKINAVGPPTLEPDGAKVPRAIKPPQPANRPDEPLPLLTGDHYQAFKESWQPTPPWKLVGPDAAAVTRFEPRGVRIVFPLKRKVVDIVGLALNARIKGNFEITAGYEILQMEQPKEGHGVGFEVFLTSDTKARDNLGLMRVSRVNEGEVYLSSHITTENGKRQYRHGFKPAPANSGYLRLTRVGSEVALFAAEGETGAFREVGQVEYGVHDLTQVRLSAYPGHAQNALDLIIKDFRLRSSNQVAAPNAATVPPLPSEPRAPQASRVRLAVIGVGLFICLLLGAAAWLYLRPAGHAGKAVAAASHTQASSIVTPCPKCRKNLRARAELAGRKVKCPHCGGAVQFPVAAKT